MIGKSRYSDAINYTGAVLEGELPPKAMKLVREWIALHKVELLNVWQTQEFTKIEPLK